MLVFLEFTQDRRHHASPILILSASGCFNLDEMSLKHIGRAKVYFDVSVRRADQFFQQYGRFYSGSHGGYLFIDLEGLFVFFSNARR